MQTEYLPVGLNAFLSAAIGAACLCRLKKMNCAVLARIKLAYLLLLMGAAANFMSPWKFEMPGWPSVLFSASVLAILLADANQWRRGPPRESTADRAPLENPHVD